MADATPVPAPLHGARPSRGELIYWSALFAIIGPLIGAIIPVIALSWSAAVNLETGWIGVAVVLLTGLPAAYIFGLVPGALVGAVGAFLAARLGDRRRTILAVAPVGAAASALWALLISGFSELDPWVLAWLALAGAIAAAACAFLATARDGGPGPSEGP